VGRLRFLFVEKARRGIRKGKVRELSKHADGKSGGGVRDVDVNLLSLPDMHSSNKNNFWKVYRIGVTRRKTRKHPILKISGGRRNKTVGPTNSHL